MVCARPPEVCLHLAFTFQSCGGVMVQMSTTELGSRIQGNLSQSLFHGTLVPTDQQQKGSMAK